MNKLYLFVGLALLFSLCTNRIPAQTSLSQQHATVKPGNCIRLQVEGMPLLVGKYDRFTGDSIAIQLGRENNSITMIVPINQIIKIEVPPKSRFTPCQKILIGTLIGAASGLLFGLVVPDSPTLDHGGFYYWTREGTMMLWGAIGAGSGALVGIGVVAASPHRWSPATIAGEQLNYSANFTGISIVWRTRFGN